MTDNEFEDAWTEQYLNARSQVLASVRSRIQAKHVHLEEFQNVTFHRVGYVAGSFEGDETNDVFLVRKGSDAMVAFAFVENPYPDDQSLMMLLIEVSTIQGIASQPTVWNFSSVESSEFLRNWEVIEAICEARIFVKKLSWRRILQSSHLRGRRPRMVEIKNRDDETLWWQVIRTKKMSARNTVFGDEFWSAACQP